jgi:hypothetical protein
MAKGGSREGAGRKPGVPNRRTAEKAAAIEASGLTPLDFMLSVLRNEDNTTEDRMDAAKAAAPYVHAKLASVEHKGDGGGALEVIFRTVYEQKGA